MKYFAIFCGGMEGALFSSWRVPWGGRGSQTWQLFWVIATSAPNEFRALPVGKAKISSPYPCRAPEGQCLWVQFGSVGKNDITSGARRVFPVRGRLELGQNIPWEMGIWASWRGGKREIKQMESSEGQRLWGSSCRVTGEDPAGPFLGLFLFPLWWQKGTSGGGKTTTIPKRWGRFWF